MSAPTAPTLRRLLPLIFIAVRLQAQENDCSVGCRDVLALAGINQELIAASGQGKDLWRQAQCSLRSGSASSSTNLGVNVPIYDVPVGATFSSAQQQAWQDKNCSASERQADYSSAMFKLLQVVQPGSVDKWSQCIETKCLRSSPVLQC